MDEKLMQFLQEQFDKIDAKFDKMDKRFDNIEYRLDKIEAKLSEHDEQLVIIKEQTVKNSEMLSTIEDYEKRIYNLETDVSIIKRAIRN